MLDYASFSLRVPEADVEQLDTLLRAVPAARKAAMRAAMATLWTRFTYAKSILQPDAWLPRPELPRDYLKVPPLPALADALRGGALPPLSGVARAPPPRARPPRRRLLHGTAMGHEDGPSLAPGSQPVAGAEAHAAPDALDTIIMFLARRVNLTVRPTSTPQR